MEKQNLHFKKMNFKNIKLNLLFFSLFIFFIFWARPILAENIPNIPIGTLLYRTSAGGLMYGYNTNQLLSPLGQTWLNCGHVGMYIGNNQVIEAAQGKVQIILLNHFVDLKEGEKFIGAKIPKNFDYNNKDGTTKLIELAKEQQGKGYDNLFQHQKGPNNKEWICVGLTEKLYESLDTKQQDPTLIYDPSQYSIDLTPDDYDVPENYSNSSCFSIPKNQLDSSGQWDLENKNCFSKTKEFSYLKEVTSDSSPIGWLMGRKDEQSRGPYIFFPYTQFLSNKLKDVDVKSEWVSSNFDREISFLDKLSAESVDLGMRMVTSAIKTDNTINDVLTTGVAAILDPIVNFFQNQSAVNLNNSKSLIGGIGQLFNRPDTNSKSLFQELSEEQSQQLEDALNGSQNLKNLITESANSEEQPESLNQEDTEQNQEFEKPQEEIEKIKEPEKEKLPEPQYFAGDVVINELMPGPLENQNEWIVFIKHPLRFS